MLAEHDIQPRLSRGPLAPATLARVTLDPAVAIVMLLASVAAFRQPFDSHYLVLMIVAFSLTFPGTAPRDMTVAGLARDIFASWLVVVLLLLLLGWATQSLERKQS